MESYVLNMIIVGCFSLLLVLFLRLFGDMRISKYKCEIKIKKIYNPNPSDDVIKELECLYDKIFKWCSFKHFSKLIIGFLGIIFSVIYLLQQLIQIQLFGNFNPLNELIELIKTNKIDAETLTKLQNKTNIISQNDRPTMNLYIIGQFLLAAIVVNDIFGNGRSTLDEYNRIKSSLDNGSDK